MSFVTSAFLLVGLASTAGGPWTRALPSDALILETVKVRSLHGPRLLVLWVQEFKKHQHSIEADEPYSCPDRARGTEYVRGRARLSLVDVRRGALINTVALETSSEDPTLDLPLRIREGLYAVRGPTREGNPRIMRLRDLNHDGQAHEFAIYAAETCSDVYGTLAGYSEQLDRAVWFPIDLEVDDEGVPSSETTYWLPVGFFVVPSPEGHWRFTWRYPEEPPREYRYDVEYDRIAGRFRGTEAIVRAP